LRGHETLSGSAAGEPRRRVHECVFAIPALESKAVNPRLKSIETADERPQCGEWLARPFRIVTRSKQFGILVRRTGRSNWCSDVHRLFG